MPENPSANRTANRILARLPREDFDLFPQLERLRVPSLVIHGDHDLIPLELARHIATAIPDARLEIVAECGHFAYLEQPEVVRLAIVRLMSTP